MKHLLLTLLLCILGCTTAEAATTEECCDMRALDEFLNSPRSWENDDGSKVTSSSLTKLGPGLVASRPTTPAGQPSFVTLSVPQYAQLNARVTQLETALVMPPTYIAPAGYSSPPTSVSAGQTIRVDCGALGADEGVTITLPLATAENKGYEVTVIETSGNPGLGTTNAFTRLEVLASGGQSLEACVAAPGYYMTGVYPTVTFASTGSGWVRKSYSSQ